MLQVWVALSNGEVRQRLRIAAGGGVNLGGTKGIQLGGVSSWCNREDLLVPPPSSKSCVATRGDPLALFRLNPRHELNNMIKLAKTTFRNTSVIAALLCEFKLSRPRTETIPQTTNHYAQSKSELMNREFGRA